MQRRATAVLLAVLVVASTAMAGAAAASSQNTSKMSEAQQGSAYAGTHVSFDVQANAVTNYQVGGDTVLDTVKVQSESQTSGAEGGLDLGATTSITGSALSLQTEATTHATISADGSASMQAHDNEHGILVVEAGNENQVVVASVSSGAEAESTSDSQVEVTTANGTEGAFIVVGEGSVTVNDDGDVSARLAGDSELVFRAYPDGQSERAERTEKAIASGTVTAEAYIDQQNGEVVADTVSYGENTAIEAEQSAENTVSVTVDRAQEEGKIVVTSVSEAAVGTVSNIDVTVDGEAAAQASSYSELTGAIGGDSSKYMVEQSSSASANADVYVAVNHFSERQIKMTGSDTDSGTSDGDSDDSDTGDSDGDGDTGGESGGGAPGFGVAAALVGVLGAALYALRR